MRAFGIAVGVQWLTVRRSPMLWVTSGLQLLAPPLFALLIVTSSRYGGGAGLGNKTAGLVGDPNWSSYLSVLAQLISGLTAASSGLFAAWLFGREFVDKTIGNLFAQAVPRATIAAAKLTIVGLWGAMMAAAFVPVGLLLGLPYGPPTPTGVWQLVEIGFVVLLTTWLAPVAALTATLTRSYLPSVAVLIGLTLISQIVIALPQGSWFPWSLPGLWVMSRLSTELTAVPSWHLVVVPLTAVAVSAWVVSRWRRLQVA